MAYRILYGNEILWEPYSDNTDAIIDASMSVNANAAKYLDFTIPPTHHLYNVVSERAENVWLYSDDKIIYKGFISKITLDMEGYKAISCTSVMDYLGDTHVRDYSTIEGEQPLKAPTSMDGLFQWYIDQHNKNCMDSRKRFKVGVNQAGILDENNYVYRSSTQFPTTADEISDKILDSGGYIFERYEGDTNVLDFYADAHEANTQVLDFGVNITDFTHERSVEDQYTVVYATGYTPDPPEDDKEKEMKPISLADIQNGGSPYNSDYFKLGDVLYSVSGVQRYGYREYHYSNDDITTTSYLLKAAGVVLTKLLSPTITLDVKAVDLALFMDNGYEHLQLGQAVRVRSKPHGVDEYLMISAIDLDLQDPGNTSYTIGTTYDTLTGQQSSYLKSLNSGINSSLDSVAALDKATKENAKGVDEAKKDAANATSKANDASNKADAATETANNANTKADTATDTANNANTKADEAKADATNASSKADEANTKADAATETANNASQNAQKANEFAKKAQEDAADAISNANNAVTEAEKATEIANSANTKSEQATDLANSAKQAASTASGIASEAKKTAENAKAAAEEGVAAAKDAASKAQAAADKAQADANANTKAVAQAQSTADAAKKAAADAQEKAENVESNLESANAVIEQHSNKLGELNTKVSNAVTNADAALTASTEAKQTATEASTTANTAYKDSQTAITNSTKATQTATEAKTTAESAVTTANDSLKQSSSAVQTANRIQNTLTTDYQTKADSDLLYATKSSLTETSESIKMEVSANYATKSTVEALQNVADNAIESWRGSGVPTSENKPASDWTTTEEKKRHSGDLYYDKDTGKAYRWGSDDGVVYSWVLNQDTDITKALQDASNAQKSADNAQTTANGAVTAAGNAQKSADGAQSTADSAKTAAANAQKSADSVQTDVDQLKIDIPNTYATKASLETTADSITAQVESVSTTANSAVTAASKAQQTADAINVNLTKNYQTKENADNTYATKASLTATSESLSTSITKAQQTADGAVNAASNAQQTADAININLTKNYQTTKDADDKYATQTSLNATADSITSTVSKTYATKTEVTDALDNISVGGRNIARNTSDKWSDWVTPRPNATNVVTSTGSTIYFTSKIQKGDTYMIQVEVEFDGVTASSGKRSYISLQGSVDGKWGSNKFNPWHTYKYDITDGIVAFKKLRVANVTPEPAETYADVTFRVDDWASGRYRWRRIKVEEGNKLTDWSPAPEDVDASINSLANTVETTYSTKSEVKQLSDQISSTVTEVTTVKNDLSAAKKVADDAASAASKAQQTATEAKSDAATAQSTADTAKANAAKAQSKADEAAKNLATAEENLKNLQNQADATDEQVAAAQTAVANAKKAADAAQADATNAKNAAATAQSTADTAKANAKTAQSTADTAKANAKTAQDDVNALKNRVTSAETSIKQNSDAIALRATKTEVTSAIDRISVGATNLLRNSEFFELGAVPYLNSTATKYIDGYFDGRPGYFCSDKLYIQIDLSGLTNTSNAILSFDIARRYDTQNVIIVKQGSSSEQIIGKCGAREWKRLSYHFVPPKNGVVYVRIFVNNTSGNNTGTDRYVAAIRHIKVEKGNKPTDWSPAPEDLQNDATTKANNALTSAKTYADAQIKVSADSITSTVSKTYATKTSVDNLQNIADNAIESWYLEGVPSGTNKPASDWTTDTLKKQHVGDMYYDKNTGYSYRWLQDGTAYKWTQIKDNDITTANAVANEAKSTAATAKTIANNANSTASAASTKANAAATDAATAKSTADAASKTATTAKNTADDAAATANQAQTGVDSLTTRMTSAETKIEQNSEAITLRATKTEVTEVKNTANTAKANAATAVSTANTAKSTADSVKTDLETNYSTTTQMNSAIDVKADGIVSTVSKTYQVKGDYATNSKVDTEIAETRTQISQTNEEIRMDFNTSIQTTSSNLQSKIDNTNSSMNSQFSEINKYIRFVDGKIILGETGNELMLTIQNDRVSFTQSGVEVAYFSSNTLYVKRAEILTTLRIGNHEFVPRSDGGLALRKRSV